MFVVHMVCLLARRRRLKVAMLNVGVVMVKE